MLIEENKTLEVAKLSQWSWRPLKGDHHHQDKGGKRTTLRPQTQLSSQNAHSLFWKCQFDLGIGASPELKAWTSLVVSMNWL